MLDLAQRIELLDCELEKTEEIFGWLELVILGDASCEAQLLDDLVFFDLGSKVLNSMNW